MSEDFSSHRLRERVWVCVSDEHHTLRCFPELPDIFQALGVGSDITLLQDPQRKTPPNPGISSNGKFNGLKRH